MRMMKGNRIGKRWLILREIGRGGQGVVFEVEDTSEAVTNSQFSEALANATPHIVPPENRHKAAGQLMDLIRKLPSPPKGALKELLPFEDAVNAETAIDRLKSELEAMRLVEHPALVRVLDADIESRWYVTDYYSGGTLADRLELFKGHVLEALLAFRAVVEAVVELHAAGVVHRDIKPDNIFIDSRDRLVLGDCGLAFKMEHQDRITETFENVGSRDWMPGWAMSMRLVDVEPNFDVFSLGKLLWSMISGSPRLRLWYHRKSEFDLAQRFPRDESIGLAQAILDKTVVEEPQDCLANARELLALVDRTIEALRMRIRIVNGDLIRRCLVCGQGKYEKIVDHSAKQQRAFGLEAVSRAKFRIFVCDGCGHCQLFYSTKGRPARVWGGDS